MTTDELIQRVEALAEEKPVAWLVVYPDPDELVVCLSEARALDYADGDTSSVRPLFSSSGRELVPELVRALKEALRERDKYGRCCGEWLNRPFLGTDAEFEANVDKVNSWWRGWQNERANTMAAEAALASANRRNSETIEACARAVEVFFQGSTYAGTPEGLREFERDNLTAALLASRVRLLLSNPAVAQETKE